jgi:tetratricopeptide (TPR) repeat protein
VHAPLLALVAAAGAARLALFARHELSGIRPLSDHLLTQLPIFWRYLGLFLAPVSLSLAHSITLIKDPFDGLALISLTALLIVIYIAWRARRRAPVAVLGVVWYLLFMAPSSVIPLAEHMSEHRTYEASFGLFLVAGAGWAALRARWSGRAPRLGGAGAVVVAGLAALTIARNRVWAAPIPLWQDAVEKAPDLWTAHYALANEYQYDHQCERAIAEYGRAIKLQPSQRAIVNVGTCLAQLGRLDDAYRMFQMALQVGPGVAPWLNLGLLEAARHRPEQARADFAKVLELDGKNLLARQALVDLYEGELQDPAAAARLCREIAAIDPTTEGVAECLRKHAAQ